MIEVSQLQEKVADIEGYLMLCHGELGLYVMIYSVCGEVCKCRVSHMSGTIGKIMEMACIHRM
jgi:hypothetical protein